MFSLTGSDITHLTDSDLRELVVRLCEAELARFALPISAVTAGGHQDAPDGGIDVRVNLNSCNLQLNFIPSPQTGFQVKIPDMPPAEIKKEMVKQGVLRPAIVDLAKRSGAYVIVSSSSSLTDNKLQKRLTAMNEIVNACPEATTLSNHFYDQEKLAQWLRQYPGVELWVRARLGKNLQGWQAYANWSAPAEPENSPYFFDDTIVSLISSGKHSVLEALGYIRAQLARPKECMRLVGLSGVGKTRFVQALFDSKIGDHALPQSMAIYTDIGNDPNPRPQEFLKNLIVSEQRAVVIVDNCSSELHRSLVHICQGEDNNSVNLVTIEYDVRDDEPEGTKVIRLQAASTSVIEHLIAYRYSTISHNDRHRIAEFSDGNARIALALCRAVDSSGGFATFSDADLLRRLFTQRNSDYDALLKIGEACSLVYSFDSETLEGSAAELPLLAQLADVSLEDFHRGLQQLIERNLVQCRGKWRALLPQALANKLAQQALNSLLCPKVTGIFEAKAPTRLLMSFARRLGYLHTSEKAKAIARRWISDNGILATSKSYSEESWQALTKIAPLIPQETLNLIERKFRTSETSIANEYGPYRNSIQELLFLLAYDEQYFVQAATLLSNLAVVKQRHQGEGVDCRLKKLCQPYVSGTHANVSLRLLVVDKLFNSGDDLKIALASQCLETMLETNVSYSIDMAEFGSASRNYGYQPKTNEERIGWYRTVLNFVLQHLNPAQPFYFILCDLVGRQFRALIVRTGLINELEQIALAIGEHSFWRQGWVGCQHILISDKDELEQSILSRIVALAEKLAPVSLIDQAQVYAFGFTHDLPEYSICEHVNSKQKVTDKILKIGEECAQDLDTLESLLPQLLRQPAGYNRSIFGHGLARNPGSVEAIWCRCVQHFGEIPEAERSISLLEGVLTGAYQHSPLLVNSFLDDAVMHPILASYFPALQSAISLDERAMERVLISLEYGKAAIISYKTLSYSKTYLPIEKYIPILERIASKESGVPIAIDIFDFIIYHHIHLSGEMVAFGRNLVLLFSTQDNLRIPATNYNFNIATIIERCFVGDDSKSAAKVVCESFAKIFFADINISSDLQYPIEALFNISPEESLCAFVENNLEYICYEHKMYWQHWHGQKNPIDKLPTSFLINWALQKPETRFAALLPAITLFTEDEEGELCFSDFVQACLDYALDIQHTLNIIYFHLDPSGGEMHSIINVLDKLKRFMEKLGMHDNHVIASWAHNAAIHLQAKKDWWTEFACMKEDRFE